MLNARKLTLRKETLAELSGPELLRVAGADAAAGGGGLPVTFSCITMNPYTIATCSCPTGASCPCPTAGLGCA